MDSHHSFGANTNLVGLFFRLFAIRDQLARFVDFDLQWWDHLDNFPVMNIRERLKSETMPEHKLLEDSMNLMRKDLTRENYQHMLQKFYGFVGGVEKELEKITDTSPAAKFYIAERSKKKALEQDLNALGLSDEEIQKLPLMPVQIEAQPQAGWGMAYVIEGSTLGSQFLAKHFHEILGINRENGGRYFHGYGEQTGFFWKSFIQKLTETEFSQDQEDQVLAESKKLFQDVRSWFRN